MYNVRTYDMYVQECCVIDKTASLRAVAAKKEHLGAVVGRQQMENQRARHIATYYIQHDCQKQHNTASSGRNTGRETSPQHIGLVCTLFLLERLSTTAVVEQWDTLYTVCGAVCTYATNTHTNLLLTNRFLGGCSSSSHRNTDSRSHSFHCCWWLGAPPFSFNNNKCVGVLLEVCTYHRHFSR